jgi:hypothetical protein
MQKADFSMSSSRRARAFWSVGAGRGEIRDEVLPRVSDYDVLVAARYSGVSRGTEALVFHERVPASERQRMRAPHQSGSWPDAVKYGYASVGEVVEGAPALVGRRVFVLHPHQDLYVVPAASVTLLPDAVPDARAILAANMETAVNALWDAGALPGQRIVVIGAGVVGALVAYLAARIPGCQVTLVDIQGSRQSLAAQLGVPFALPEVAPDEADLVVHASASAAGLELALRLAGEEATVLELSWYGDARVALSLGEAFHARRLNLRASQVGRVAPVMRARWSTQRRLSLSLELLRDAALDALISGESAFEDMPIVMQDICAAGSAALCHRIRYGGHRCTA